MSENKQPAPALSESAPQPDRRDEATAIINQMIAKGGTIYKVSADDKEEAIGMVSSKDVQLTERRFSVQ